MPVKSLNSSVIKWPDQAAVDQAVRSWAAEEIRHHPDLLTLGYYGSYARGDWGVGSDLDLIAVIGTACESFERRSLNWNLQGLPVPASIMVYSSDEWQRMKDKGGKFVRTINRETKWIYKRSK